MDQIAKGATLLGEGSRTSSALGNYCGSSRTAKRRYKAAVVTAVVCQACIGGNPYHFP